MHRFAATAMQSWDLGYRLAPETIRDCHASIFCEFMTAVLGHLEFFVSFIFIYLTFREACDVQRRKITRLIYEKDAFSKNQERRLHA